MGQVRSKKSKLILTHPYGAELKSRLIPAPPPLWDGENPHGIKQGEVGQAGRGKIVIPSPHMANCDKNCGLFFMSLSFSFFVTLVFIYLHDMNSGQVLA